jgi:hypothetical protein
VTAPIALVVAIVCGILLLIPDRWRPGGRRRRAARAAAEEVEPMPETLRRPPRPRYPL